MINEETRRKLREINLGEAIKGLEVQQADPATIALPFDERMQRLVDYIYQEKYNGKIQRLIKSAKLRFPQANRQGVIYASRGLNRELLENLFRFAPEHHLPGIYRFREDLPSLCPGKRSLPEPCQGTVCQAA